MLAFLDEIAGKFGFEWGKFIAQILIFLIVFAVLKWKAFGPVQSILAQRQKRIEDGENNLKKIKEDLENAEAKAQQLIDQANASAERMIEEARTSASALNEKKTKEATAEAATILAKAREASQLEKEQAISELKRDFSRLVVDTTSKVTGKVLTSEDQNKINQETAGQIAV
ncbi:MAG: F-type H+-transporting ATPase subunit b [Verrucomicrobiales bacterium]|jgi:F-type H+-transporting ATPase subunit b